MGLSNAMVSSFWDSTLDSHASMHKIDSNILFCTTTRYFYDTEEENIASCIK